MKIYILLTRPTTIVSSAIQRATRDEFTHISMAFNKELSPLYSFSRKYAPTPLPAGMTTEAIEMGFYKDRGFINCALYQLEVPEQVYNEARAITEGMYKNSQAYKFNILGLALCRLNIPLDRDKHYFCSQFVSHVLVESSAIELSKPTGLIRPADFMVMPEFKLIFQGNLTSLARYLASENMKGFPLPGLASEGLAINVEL
ncbi:MAG: hypothetical protein GX079_04255 [Tissierellia bacterium]|nr:hypothetical protein [Tissierellia bacterium]